MCWTWILTVLSATSRSRAISLLLAPRARCCRISRSRGLNAGPAGAPGVPPDAHLAQQLARHLRRQHRFAVGRAAYGVDEEFAVDVLQQVAERAGAQRGHQIVRILGHRQHHDVGFRSVGEDRLHRVDAGDARHVEIEQHDVGPVQGDGLDALESVRGLARHVEPGNARQQRRDAASEERVIVDDDDADRPRLVRSLLHPRAQRSTRRPRSESAAARAGRCSRTSVPRARPRAHAHAAADPLGALAHDPQADVIRRIVARAACRRSRVRCPAP